MASPATPEAVDVAPAELARAARILAVRTRREATGSFAGSYASAFRGGGMEFAESRPYVPGDDVRYLDWNAMARTGEPFVKRYREERDQTLWLALDVSASMRFGAEGGVPGAAKGARAAHAAALLAAAAGHAGDRVGLLAFDEGVVAERPAARGAPHVWEVIRTAAVCAGRAAGRTRLAPGLEALRAAGPKAICALISDFRDPELLDADGERSPAWSALAATARRHDVVSLVLHDPREESLPRAGLVRLRDPERPGRSLLIHTGRARSRARYRRAWAAWRQAVERALRSAGSEVLLLRSDRDPLPPLMQFFRERASRPRPVR